MAETRPGAGGRWAMLGLLLAAWIAGVTSPVMASEPPLKILSGARTLDGSFRLQIAASNTITYLVHASTNLLHWIPLSTNVAAGPLDEFVDLAASAHRQRFYRLAQCTGGLVLSTNRANPGETLVISGGSFNPDTPVFVHFQDATGMEIRVRSFSVTTGTVAVAVPFLVNADSPQLRGGLATVSVRQESPGASRVFTSAQSLQIADLFTTGLSAGAVTLEYLNQLSNYLGTASSRWQTIDAASQGKVNTASLRLNLLMMQTNVVAAQREIQRIVSGQTSRIPMGRLRDREVFLDLDAVVLIDRMLAATFLNTRATTLLKARSLSAFAAGTTGHSEILESIRETFDVGSGKSAQSVFDVFDKLNSIGGLGVGILATTAVVLGVASAPAAAALAGTAGAVLFFSTYVAPAVIGASVMSLAAPFMEVQSGRPIMLEDYQPALNHIQKGSQAYLRDEFQGKLLEGVLLSQGANEDLIAQASIFVSTSKSILENQDLAQPQSAGSLAISNSATIFANLAPTGGEPAIFSGHIDETFTEIGADDIAAWEDKISAIVTVTLVGQGTVTSPFSGKLQFYGTLVSTLLYCHEPFGCDSGGTSMLRLDDGLVSGTSGTVTADGTLTISNEIVGAIPIPLQFRDGVIRDDPVTGRNTLTGTLVLVNFQEWAVTLTRN